MFIQVLDYGAGNIRSICSALEYLGCKYKICQKNKNINPKEKLIIPGVGSFRKAMENLQRKQLIDTLSEYKENGVPLMGICLGMQLLFDESEEDGNTIGLKFFNGSVRKFPENLKNVKVPNIGFSQLELNDKNTPDILKGIPEIADFYFLHSYAIFTPLMTAKFSFSQNGMRFVSVIQNKNIVGVQFHPEKSQTNGLKLLNNFREM